jgi:hypothetical protein
MFNVIMRHNVEKIVAEKKINFIYGEIGKYIFYITHLFSIMFSQSSLK